MRCPLLGSGIIPIGSGHRNLVFTSLFARDGTITVGTITTMDTIGHGRCQELLSFLLELAQPTADGILLTIGVKVALFISAHRKTSQAPGEDINCNNSAYEASIGRHGYRFVCCFSFSDFEIVTIDFFWILPYQKMPFLRAVFPNGICRFLLQSNVA